MLSSNNNRSWIGAYLACCLLTVVRGLPCLFLRLEWVAIWCLLFYYFSAERKVRVFAVEKNSNAVITLRNRVLEEWEPNGAKVEVIAGDMRQWQAPEKADIFVSELLGSFADNELSPDCLDGAQERFLKPDGISIPSRYTSYLAPMQSTKIYNDIVKLRGKSEALQPHYVSCDIKERCSLYSQSWNQVQIL